MVLSILFYLEAMMVIEVTVFFGDSLLLLVGVWGCLSPSYVFFLAQVRSGQVIRHKQDRKCGLFKKDASLY